MRNTAVAVLKKLDPAALASHAESLLSLLSHENSHVRNMAVGVLLTFDATALAQHIEALTKLLSGASKWIHRSNAEKLHELEPSKFHRRNVGW